MSEQNPTVTFTDREMDTMAGLRARLVAHVTDPAEARFVWLLRALALAQQNSEAKDQCATLAIKLTIRKDGEGYYWEARGDVSHPAVAKGEPSTGAYNPNQPDLPGTEDDQS
jgi:hypothetical protein